MNDLKQLVRAITQLIHDVSSLVRTENEIRTQIITEPKTNLGRPKR